MIENLQNLIHALREELQQYGEMLARLDQQQEWVTRRAPDDLLQSTADIEAQSEVIQTARRQRLERQRTVACGLQLKHEAPFAEIIPLLPADYRPLVTALVQENNELLLRVQQRSRQNHVLLARSLELMSRLIGTLLPSGPTVYTDKGNVTAPILPTRSLCNAIG